jgi:hypothetical protein
MKLTRFLHVLQARDRQPGPGKPRGCPPPGEAAEARTRVPLGSGGHAREGGGQQKRNQTALNTANRAWFSASPAGRRCQMAARRARRGGVVELCHPAARATQLTRASGASVHRPAPRDAGAPSRSAAPRAPPLRGGAAPRRRNAGVAAGAASRGLTWH